MKRSQQTVLDPTNPDIAAAEPAGGEIPPSLPPGTPIPSRRRAASGLANIRKVLGATSLLRGIVGIVVFVGLWQVGTDLDEWVGVSLPFVARLPTPASVGDALVPLVSSGGFWESAYLSFVRVMWGFTVAMVIGIPFGLLMAVSRTAKAVCFPPFEILRPIPPLAWVPAAIIFWPTQELSITFVTFLGAFFTVVINTVGGAEQVDRRFLLAARSMGADKATIFRRVLLPATLPSIATGAVVGMGITWQVVVAAEMISGGGQGGATGGGGGLGFLIWNSYLGGAIPQVVVGMIGLGIAGYLSSTLVRILSTKLMPWQRAT
ncbi:MAG: ABC transporter permease [Acidimicrobiia bacterium]